MMFFNNNNRKSNTNIKKSEIHSEDGEPLVFEKTITTAISEFGDITTIETNKSMIIGGIKVSSSFEIFGKCMECGDPIPQLTKRMCFCGKIICLSCSRWWEDDKRPVCLGCYKTLKWKKFWNTLWYVLTAPFVERRED